MLGGVLTSCWETLFPDRCLGCTETVGEGARFCPRCIVQVEEIPDPRCHRCGEPYPGSLCSRCQRAPPPFLSACAPFMHGGAVARAIQRFKYEDHPELAEPLACVLADAAGDWLWSAPKLTCAVPLHPRRLRMRRYDHARLLVRQLTGLTGRTDVSVLLRRVRHCARQVGLSDAEREANVAGAFLASRGVKGHSILLVDDVLTTGATARAATSALLEAGAAEVHLLTFARAVHYS